MEELSQEFLTTVIQPRPHHSHKGTFGRSVLIGGNETYGGAIIMSAEACLKSGSGLTSVITAEKNHAALHARLPEAMVLDWVLTQEFNDLVDTADVLLIGPGLGLSAHSEQLLETVLQRQKPEQWLVLDGSAITLFAQNHYALPYPEQVVFTPHQMEWTRLSGLKIGEQTFENNQAMQKQLGATIILKSHRTELYMQNVQYKNPLGTPAMATGGMGDTLAGMITGFLAQFKDKEGAICAAVYLHSLIGEELGKENYVVLPTEISKNLPHYMKRFERLKNKTEEK
ncbi:NAD(P)H-hydrate dehydratase [Enterococcus caccae]|uniref:ADP-dependent (S)-NAD(P)H-hydrate dehydratase n=1 Tax=Enterococcus caccae ATCC BAA-1240 TaxID=1158612 RepID=R3WCK6_9ENTE|nr:NAD(P)H-hydrate dehydratase [Enterococcus caccae]EOL45207.1 YjeF family domain-containing protein [Enterococcus caccae ATCC BAA-1240]EOT58614.1 YjeF family domain-containing protein [Enterococcus caccae ATCC BAA-1240]OJG27058.1 YjeF family domain-containing protein [Enterococcus caccae]